MPNPGNLFGVTNWNSVGEVAAAFAALGVALGSTDDDALAALDHPAAALLREYRAAAKLSGTYGREWLRHVGPDGRVSGVVAREVCANGAIESRVRESQLTRLGAAYRVENHSGRRHIARPVDSANTGNRRRWRVSRGAISRRESRGTFRGVLCSGRCAPWVRSRGDSPGQCALRAGRWLLTIFWLQR